LAGRLPSKLRNPFLNTEPSVSRRDPALVFNNGVFHCFHTVVENKGGRFKLYLDVTRSENLVEWSEPERLTTSELGFSSPGNVIIHNGEWVMCVQSYPVPVGENYAGEDARLWLMKSPDLYSWSEPQVMVKDGCRVKWTESRRQIDPFIVERYGEYFCFYKTSGSLGLLISKNMNNWREASPEKAALSSWDTPDGVTVENPCVVKDGDEYVLFFSPCREGRGIGTARSTDLIEWFDVEYIDFPYLDWADGGPSAAMVLDTRKELGGWLMAFHGEIQGPHGAALGLAWSDDLLFWHLS